MLLNQYSGSHQGDQPLSLELTLEVALEVVVDVSLLEFESVEPFEVETVPDEVSIEKLKSLYQSEASEEVLDEVAGELVSPPVLVASSFFLPQPTKTVTSIAVTKRIANIFDIVISPYVSFLSLYNM